MNFFKEMDGYGKFLFIVLGVPAIIAAFAITGICAIAMVKSHGWYTIPIMFFYPPMAIGFAIGMMGAFNSGTSMFPRDWSDAKCFCNFWLITSGGATVALGTAGVFVYYAIKVGKLVLGTE